MSNIKDIVEQVREVPSPRCWKSIASQLPAAGAAIGGGSVAATATKGALTVGKLAAIIGSTAAVVAIVTGTTIAILKHEPMTDQQTDNQTNKFVTVTDSTASETSTLLCQVEEKTLSVAKGTPVASTATKSAAKENTPSFPTPDDQASTDVSTAVTPSPSTSNTSQFSVSSNANPNSAPTSIPDKTSANNSIPTPTPNIASDQNATTGNDIVTSNQNEELSLSKPVTIEIPNVFTPNGDGVNDQFIIKGLENCEKKTLIVKDKSGQIVFQNRNYDNSWDGGNLPDGSYYYQFFYSINNINELRQGVILIRR